MKIDFNTIKLQAQDYLLRLFIENSSHSSSSSSYYTCARCGTHARIHQ